MKFINKLFLFTFLALFLGACSDALNVDPKQSIDSSNLITDASTAAVAMNGLYSNAQDFWRDPAYYSIDVLSDITDHSGTYTTLREFDENDPMPDNGTMRTIYRDAYALIYNANLIIDVLPKVEDKALEPLQKGYIGEALALRSYAYYYLTMLFNEVPLVLTPVGQLSDVNKAPSSRADIFTQILTDLQTAEGSLGDGAATGVTKTAVQAMIAKIAAAKGDWTTVSTYADKVLEKNSNLETNYMDLYNGNISAESIFQLDFNSTDKNSLSFFYWDKPNGRHEVAPSQTIIDAFEEGDTRRASVAEAIGGGGSPNYVTKWSDFANGSDKPIILRVADIMLLKAEALAEAKNYGDASAIINTVRARAGLGEVTLTEANAKELILKERMIELAWEGGHRWFDMLRSGQAEAYVTAKGQDACKIVLPIPVSEVDANTALKQNPCY